MEILSVFLFHFKNIVGWNQVVDLLIMSIKCCETLLHLLHQVSQYFSVIFLLILFIHAMQLELTPLWLLLLLIRSQRSVFLFYHGFWCKTSFSLTCSHYSVCSSCAPSWPTVASWPCPSRHTGPNTWSKYTWKVLCLWLSVCLSVSVGVKGFPTECLTAAECSTASKCQHTVCLMM